MPGSFCLFVVCFVLCGSFKVVRRTAGFCFVFEGKGLRAAVHSTRGYCGVTRPGMNVVKLDLLLV